MNESVRHHFRNYLWLNNKQVLKALVSSSSPGFFSAQLHFALKAQLAKNEKKKKSARGRQRERTRFGEIQETTKREDEDSVERQCEGIIKVLPAAVDLKKKKFS